MTEIIGTRHEFRCERLKVRHHVNRRNPAHPANPWRPRANPWQTSSRL